MTKAKKSDTAFLRPTPKDWDLPATQGMLHLVRSQLSSEMKAGFKEVDARFCEVDGRFNEMEARFSRLDSKMDQVLSEVSRIGVVVEEQNSRNRVVLEGITALWQRQDRFEMRMEDFEKVIRSIGRTQGGK